MASGSSTPTRLVLNVEGYIVGYHVYQRIWNPVIDEVATVVREEDNVQVSRFGFFLGGSADVFHRIGRGPSTRLKKLVIFVDAGSVPGLLAELVAIASRR